MSDDDEFNNIGKVIPISKTIKVPVQGKVGSNDYKVAHVRQMGYLTDETNPQLQALAEMIRTQKSKPTKDLLHIIYKAANILETNGHFTEANDIRSAALDARSK